MTANDDLFTNYDLMWHTLMLEQGTIAKARQDSHTNWTEKVWLFYTVSNSIIQVIIITSFM